MNKASVKKNVSAKPLRPFNQDDRDYFSEYSQQSIHEKLEGLEDDIYMLSIVTKDILNPTPESNHASYIRANARSCRILFRDFTHYFSDIVKHLKIIEVTGDCSSMMPTTTSDAE